METTTLDEALSDFVSERPRIFGIAYRMLGCAAEAEDIVQNVWLRWQTTDRSVVRNAPGFLSTTTTRLAINVFQSARSRHETYVGALLPEPVDTSADPGLGAERGEALESAILLLLEKLSPTERAAYVLREAFDYSYKRIAGVLKLGEANTRQLVTRARKHISDGRSSPVSSAEQRPLLNAFIAAAQGDLAALEGLFASELSGAQRPADSRVRLGHRFAVRTALRNSSRRSALTSEPVSRLSGSKQMGDMRAHLARWRRRHTRDDHIGAGHKRDHEATLSQDGGPLGHSWCKRSTRSGCLGR